MFREAVRHLKAADPVLGKLIERVGPCRFRPQAEGTHFGHVVRAIVYQQLSGKAAGTIHKRLLALFDGQEPLPLALLRTPDEKLRQVGLSRQKLSYLKDLASKVEAGEVPIESLHELDDDAIIETLIRVKGIGRWTAHMFLMFRLGRPNVLPTLDLGIQKAVKLAYGLRGHPDPKRVAKVAAPWHPYCTIACWYLWRSLD